MPCKIDAFITRWAGKKNHIKTKKKLREEYQMLYICRNIWVWNFFPFYGNFLLDMSKNSIQHFHLGLSSFFFSLFLHQNACCRFYPIYPWWESEKLHIVFERKKKNELLNDAARIKSFEWDNQRWHYKIFQVTIKLRRSSTTNEMKSTLSDQLISSS